MNCQSWLPRSTKFYTHFSESISLNINAVIAGIVEILLDHGVSSDVLCWVLPTAEINLSEFRWRTDEHSTFCLFCNSVGKQDSGRTTRLYWHGTGRWISTKRWASKTSKSALSFKAKARLLSYSQWDHCAVKVYKDVSIFQRILLSISFQSVGETGDQS